MDGQSIQPRWHGPQERTLLARGRNKGVKAIEYSERVDANLARAEAKRRLCGPTPDDECRAWEAAYPGWRVWVDDDGRVHASDGDVTLNPPGMGLVGYIIADYLHRQEFAAKHPVTVTA